MIEPGKHSPLWKLWRSVGSGKENRFFLEHSEAVLELFHSESPPEQILLARSRYSEEPSFWHELAQERPSCTWYLLEDERLDKMVTVRSFGGVCGLFAPRPASESELREKRFLLLTWELQDPGNLGTLIRSCAAFTSGGVVAVGGCRLWSSKVARASAGSLLRVPARQIPLERGISFLKSLKSSQTGIYSTLPRGGRLLTRWKPAAHSAVVLGNETHGLPDEVQKFTEPLTIPTSAQVESLNAGVAGAIVCYEWSRVMGDRA